MCLAPAIGVPAHVTQGTAPIDEETCYLYDSTGKEIDSSGGGASTDTEGTMRMDVPLPGNPPAGIYTVGFTLTDSG